MNAHVTNEMIWSTLAQYRIILDYILVQAAFPYTCTLVSGKKPGKAEYRIILDYILVQATFPYTCTLVSGKSRVRHSKGLS